ncbi:DUF1761 domain-containing protein [Tamlana haliotis]|uniref:DUF1761 domain-containing protein n=1 Tax=Pseudotamlana haliotis TaxID=2614804 RepID=A0A6N6MD54_9FLAO|nr:DUF1761 domain-containing protein [Tamlana haliotis]KAB1066767.1 DUF1761 domain-containing protein [Tamlana haliotis]
MEAYYNLIAMLVAAFSALVIGSIWYHPKVFGNAWLKAAELNDKQMKSGSMVKIFGLALLFAFMLSTALPGIVIHQVGALSLIGGDPTQALASYDAFIADYATNFRTFKHGALHGILTGIFVVLPVLGTNALFERKGAKYIFINSGYWIVTLAIMGGIICAWK